MTIDEFLEKLAGLGLIWCLEDGAIRCNGHCPISALTGSYVDYCRARIAGVQKLGLSDHDARQLVFSADSPFYAEPDLRSRLLKACGLEEMT